MIYDKIMKFGYHDTDATGISYDESRIILDFEKAFIISMKVVEKKI